MDAVWPLAANIGVLGFANGVFAVSAIGAMMSLAGGGSGADTGLRMGGWGAGQGGAFGLGGLLGAIGGDMARRAPSDGPACYSTFGDRDRLVDGAAGGGGGI